MRHAKALTEKAISRKFPTAPVSSALTDKG
jgi:hypothetical protein